MILVTGGTGLVGSHLLYFLATSGANLRATHRKTSDLSRVEKIFGYYTDKKTATSLFNTIEWVQADITDIPALTIAFKNCKQVYHCAAIIDFDPKKYELLKKVNTQATANIVNLALAHGIKKLCYVSSIATLGNPEDGSSITEDTHFNQDAANNVYSLSKYAAEMEVWRATQEGLDAVIVNPGVILGAGSWRTGSGAIFKLASKGMSYFTSGSIAVVDVRDVVLAMQGLMNSDLKNERYILVGATLSYKEFTKELALAFDKNPPKKEIAEWKLLLISSIDGLVSSLFGTKRKLQKANVKSLYTRSNYNAYKIEKALSFSFTTVSQTIKRVASDYKSEH